MEERERWARRLNKLLEINFRIARTYRRMMESVSDGSLRTFLGRLASERFKFAMELEQEIAAMGGKVSAETRNHARIGLGSSTSLLLFTSNVMLLRNCIKKNKSCIRKYKKALAKINDGSSREKLLRHLATYQKDIKQLKILKEKYAPGELPDNSMINGTK